MNRHSFINLVERIFAGIPAQFRQQVENLSIQVEDWADAETLAELGFAHPRDLLGEYRGVPLDERGFDMLPGLPDVIVLYQGAIETEARASGLSLARVIRETLVHELGHYFGFSEPEMDRIEALWAGAED